MLIAITREVSRSIKDCELTYLPRIPIDIDLARRQHRAYRDALSNMGAEVVCLPEEPAMPDSVFVEDIAVVLDECAIITLPGPVARRMEIPSIVDALKPYRELRAIEPPGSLEGGDVLVLGRNIYIGMTGRSNEPAASQVRAFLEPFGYRVHTVPVNGCLHLKSAITQLGRDSLLINPGWVERTHFHGWRFFEVDPGEPFAANVLWIGDRVLYQPAFPKTCAKLEAAGFNLLLTDQSELGKGEGALTCCSLIFQDRGGKK